MSTLGAGVWLELAKKRSGVPSLTDDEAVGLCYGWISGQRKAYHVPVAISSEPDAAQARAGRSGDRRGRGIQS